MKRLLIVAVVLGAATVMASAAGAQSSGTPNPPTTVGRNFVDANGDGVCDNCTGTPRGQGQKVRKGNGGPGSGNGAGQGMGPRDGSGSGRGGGRGTCNVSGPRGRGRGRR